MILKLNLSVMQEESKYSSLIKNHTRIVSVLDIFRESCVDLLLYTFQICCLTFLKYFSHNARLLFPPIDVTTNLLDTFLK